MEDFQSKCKLSKWTFILKKKESTGKRDTSATDIGHVNDGHVDEENFQAVENGNVR